MVSAASSLRSAPFAFFLLALLAFSSHAESKDTPVLPAAASPTTTTAAGHKRRLHQVPGLEVLNKRATPDAAVSSALLASSIVNSYSTASWIAAGDDGCASDETTYTDDDGDTKCCAGSIIDSKCYADTADAADGSAITYTKDWASIIVVYDVSNSVYDYVSSTATSSTAGENTSTITDYTAVETGGTKGVTSTATTTTYSSLSETLEPTSGTSSAGTGSTGTSTSGAESFGITLATFLMASMVVFGAGVVML